MFIGYTNLIFLRNYGVVHLVYLLTNLCW